MPYLIKIAGLFVLTALAEIVGCYLPWLVLKGGRGAWLLVPAAVSLALFAWLLTLQPSAAGRTYAAYGGVYIAVALVWLRVVDGIALSRWDWAGAALALAGMAVIALQPRGLARGSGPGAGAAAGRAAPARTPPAQAGGAASWRQTQAPLTDLSRSSSCA